MELQYQPEMIEAEAQYFWSKNKSFNVKEDLNKEKFYCLAMFPYPSGQLHMGHVRNYTITDVIARYQRMRGKNVLQPMGWDSFGLPAENAALKRGVAPAEWTYQNIEQMKAQLKQLGFGYDWTREIATCNPDYHRWEQWLFTKLFEKGLAYKKNATVNWDPVDQTVLANEQVIDGKGWRSGAPVEQREISQWFFKITDYAEELLRDIDRLEHWPEQVRTMQRNWIGRSEGLTLYFEIDGEDERLEIYTTRPDTLFGASYMAVAPQHPIAKKAAAFNSGIQAFIDECQKTHVSEANLAKQKKEGIDSGFKAKHPITGELVPIWIANFVLMSYGSGAVMAVPAHDQRDYEFATKYQLPIQVVIQPEDGVEWDYSQSAFTDLGILVNSGDFTGLRSYEAKTTIVDRLSASGKAKRSVHYRLRDWGVSRQRYWGAPIPIIHCEDCGAVPVPEPDLPVRLPENVKLEHPGSPLADMPEFVDTTCPKCGKAAKRETDTFDTFVESSWYYARYACPDQHSQMLDDRSKYWTPVDQYVGGIEHAVMHLLYARFFHKVLRDEGLLNSSEPFTRLLTQGMVLKDGAKMSKSKGNVVDPNELIQQYGADTVRLFTMFAAPPERSLEWSDSGVEGAWRFLKRVWSFAEQHQAMITELNESDEDDEPLDWSEASTSEQNHRRDLYTILAQANFDMDRQQYNTVVSAAMKLVNTLHEASKESDSVYKQQLIQKGLSIILRLLAPITPHICHHLWRELGYGEDILKASWPKVSKQALETKTVELVVQVNGRLRDQIAVPEGTDEETITSLAIGSDKVQNALAGRPHKKVIHVPGRLINIVG